MNNTNPLTETKNRWIKDLFLVGSLTVVCYFITLRFIYPGFFHPLAPWHEDNYGYYTMVSGEQKWDSLINESRFVVLIVLGLFSSLSFDGFNLCLIGISLLGIALTVYLIKQITKINFSWPIVIIYLINIFAHPAFYFNYTFDIFDTISYIFLVLIMISWYKYNRLENKIIFFGMSVLPFLCLLSKETFTISLLLFWLFQVIFSNKKKASTIQFVISIIASVVSIIHSNEHSGFVDPNANAASPYFISTDPASIAHVMLVYLKEWVNVGFLVIVIFSLVLCWLLKSYIKESILFILMGLSAYLPYSVLPNHVFSFYSWLSVPLSYCAVLFIHPSVIDRFKSLEFPFRSWKLNSNVVRYSFYVLIVLMTILGLKLNSAYSYNDNSFNLLQQKINANVLNNFKIINDNVKPGDKVLVTGLYSPYNAFTDPTFILETFNRYKDVDWTLATLNEEESMSQDGFTKKKITATDLGSFDKIFCFNEMGQLIRIMDRTQINQINKDNSGSEITDMDVLLYPKLGDLRKELEHDPSNSAYLMEVGQVYMDNGLLDKAESFFKSSISSELEHSDSPNPYPFFFLGNVYELEKKLDDALNAYKKSVEYDSSGNPFFEEAVKRLEDKIQ